MECFGKKIITLLDQKKEIGIHNLTYKATNLASGTYISVLKSESEIDARKVVLIK